MPSRITLCSLALVGLSAAFAGGQGSATERVYLSGTGKDATVPWDFRVSAGRQAGVWTTIPVPSCWETKGFGTYRYGNWSVNDEYGEYRKTFDIPPSWGGRRTFLVYEGAMAETETLVNGVPAGGTAAPSTALANDRALDNSAATSGGNGGVARSSVGNLALGSRTAFTLSGWIKPATAAGLTTGFPRLMLLGAATGYDAGAGQQGAYLSIYNGSGTASALQFKVNGDTGNGAITPSGVLTGTDWIFVAVSYDSTLPNNQVKFHVGQRLATLTAPVATATYGGGAAVDFGSAAHATLLNRSNRGRAFSGLGDDFRIHAGALDSAALDTVRASAVSTAAVPPAVTPLYQWNFNDANSSSTALPQVGVGGELSLRNAADVATDLHTAVGGGVSGGSPGGPGGLHRGGFYEFGHEITGQVQPGANLLEVTVRKTTGDTSINNAERKGDYWNFGGIYRPVYLESRPAAHLERLAVDPRHTGALTVHAFLSGNTAAATVTSRVTTLAGAPVGTDFQTSAAAGAESVAISTVIPGVQPWSPEFPNLYRLTVELRDAGNGEIIHTLAETIGFRTIQMVAGEGFHLNGKRLCLRGTVHHEFWPDQGRTSSRQQSIDDILLMKAMHMNVVRRAHYPATREFYQETDRLGILVLDELGGWQNRYSDAAAPDLVRELVIRDVNHPSVIAWANGNEGGANPTVDDDFALWDPQNRTVFHPVNWDHAFGGLKTHHYSSFSQLQNYLGAGKTAFMTTENLHGLYDGGGGAGLADYWQAIRTAPNGAGLLIWAFIDEGLKRDDQGGNIDVMGDAAPDGLLGPYREKEAGFYTVREIWSPVQITSQLASGNPLLTLENRYDFTNLNQCTFQWKLGWFPDPGDPATALNGGFLAEVVSAVVSGPDIAPGATGIFNPGLPTGWERHDVLRLTATDPQGREIQTWNFALHPASNLAARISPSAVGPAITADTAGSEMVVTAGTRVFRFSKTTGQLLGASVSGEEVALANGPRPVSGGWGTGLVAGAFDGGDYRVTFNDPAASADAFEWRVRPDGWLGLSYRYTLTGPQPWLGITFDYPEADVTAMRWLGHGPYRVWKNRLAGQQLGVHRKLANNTNTGKQWGYPEFRGYHGQLHWATLETTRMPITLVSATPDLFFRVLSWPDASTTRPGVNVARPPGNLSLLHGINAIGHKFGDSASLGPQGEPNAGTGPYTGAVSFHFGALPVPTTDRDGDGLQDWWEITHLNSLASTGSDDPAGDGLPLLIKNAFDLSPLPPEPNGAIRLPKLVPGTSSPYALTYRVPEGQLNRFAFVPEISRDLETWYQTTPAAPYLDLLESTDAGDRVFTAEPTVSWAEPRNRCFMRVSVEPK